MAVNSVHLLFIWFLPLATSSSTVTSGQNHRSPDVVTSPMTTQEAFRASQLSEVSRWTTTPATITGAEEKTAKSHTNPSLQTTPSLPSKTSNIQTAGTPNHSIPSDVYSSTASSVRTSQGNPSTTTGVAPVPSTSPQSKDTGMKSTSHPTSDKTTPLSTNLISTTTSSTKSPGPATGGEGRRSTGFFKPSVAITKMPVQHPTKKKEVLKQTNHSKIVAGLIGGALALMVVGFMVIYMKKRKLQRRQITTTDWAGPTPFLEGGVDNGQVALRSSNRISLSSFLPQRLSKRLSLLPETEEELQDIVPGSTFGAKNQESAFGQETNGKDIQERKESATQVESKGEAPTTVQTPPPPEPGAV